MQISASTPRSRMPKREGPRTAPRASTCSQVWQTGKDSVSRLLPPSLMFSAAGPVLCYQAPHSNLLEIIGWAAAGIGFFQMVPFFPLVTLVPLFALITLLPLLPLLTPGIATPFLRGGVWRLDQGDLSPPEFLNSRFSPQC